MLKNTSDATQEDVLDDMFRALLHPVRRRLLFRLLDHDPCDPFLDPEAVALGTEAPEPLRHSLYHRHLPMLEQLGFIDWDREANELHMGSDFTRIRNPLSALREEIQNDEIVATGRSR